MKIYYKEPIQFVRLQVTQQKQETEYLTLVECTVQEVKQELTKLIESQNISPFETKKTSINIREATGGLNGKSVSISFRGLNPKETIKLIEDHINKNQKP